MNSKPVWYVIAEQDRTVTQFSVYNIIDVIAGDLEDFDAMYNEHMVKFHNPDVYRQVNCFIFNRVPEDFSKIARQAYLGNTGGGKTAAIGYQIEHARREGKRVEVLETKEKQENEVPYHERVWNE